jgi:hypothetical protein
MNETDHPFKSKGDGWAMDSQSRLGIIKKCSADKLEIILSKEGQKLCPTTLQKTVEKAARGRLKRLKKEVKDSLAAQVESAAECLPEGYSILIHVQKGAAQVTVMRPDESEVQMWDSEDDLEADVDFTTQLMEALLLINDESRLEQITREKADKEEIQP